MEFIFSEFLKRVMDIPLEELIKMGHIDLSEMVKADREFVAD